jgi:hypothetical protein
VSDKPEANRPTGRARVGRAVGKAPLPERASTSIIRDGRQEPTPVFVDPSGSRRKRLRRFAYVVGALLVVAMLALWLSQFGSSVRPAPANQRPSTSAGTGR